MNVCTEYFVKLIGNYYITQYIRSHWLPLSKFVFFHKVVLN